MSVFKEQAVEDALRYGKAIMKFISPNDVGITGSHQCGFYMPFSAWSMYTPYAPKKGENRDHEVRIIWPDRVTRSKIKWYGKETRHEYRLTCFGKDFSYLIPDTVGDLLVIIPKSTSEFFAYVLDDDDDIDEIITALGVSPFEHWAVYDNGKPVIEGENECIEKKILGFIKDLTSFPSGSDFSKKTREILLNCYKNFSELSPDDALLKYYQTEYQLFQYAERQICHAEIARVFRDIDDFLKTAASIMNRRKSRAGRSLENHVDYILQNSNIPHKMQPKIDGCPDIIIPDEKAYYDNSYQKEKIFIVGLKTTCKDRWRQVLNEGIKIKKKYILTLQPSISGRQLEDMRKANVSLIIPKKLQKDYPKNRSIEILELDKFIQLVDKVSKHD